MQAGLLSEIESDDCDMNECEPPCTSSNSSELLECSGERNRSGFTIPSIVKLQ